MGRAAPTVEDKEVQPQHMCTLALASQGSDTTKAPMQRQTSLSLLSSARPGTGLVVLSLR